MNNTNSNTNVTAELYAIGVDEVSFLINDKVVNLKTPLIGTVKIAELKVLAIAKYNKELREKMLPPSFEEERKTDIAILFVSKNRVSVLRGSMKEILTSIVAICEVQGILWGMLYSKDAKHSIKFSKKSLQEPEWNRMYYAFCLQATLAETL